MLTINETDQVNSPLATYVYSESRTTSHPKGRVDVLPPHLVASSTADRTGSTSVIQSWVSYPMSVFLPAGFPHTVTKDYLEYQIYACQDSVQAFASSIAGLLSSRAVLQGVGVGDAAASPTSVLLLQILQDTSGRIATILFAHRLGTALEPECKMYRLAADVFNNIAMVLDCLSPLVSLRSGRIAVISGASVLRALCGVAAGSSKASLSAHFALNGNIGELNAKDSSLKTTISLLGMLAGSIVVSQVTSFPATWISLISLLVIHLATNYRAVRAVEMTTLNRQRTNIVFSGIFETDQSIMSEKRTQISTGIKILPPAEVAQQERIFEKEGVLRWTSLSTSSSSKISTEEIGWCRIGVSVQEVLSSASTTYLPALLDTFSSEAYVIFLVPTLKHHKRPRVLILLKCGCTPIQQLKAWAHSLLVAKTIRSGRPSSDGNDGNNHAVDGNANERGVLEILSYTLKILTARFDTHYVPQLERAGWDLHTAALETSPGRRIDILE